MAIEARMDEVCCLLEPFEVSETVTEILDEAEHKLERMPDGSVHDEFSDYVTEIRDWLEDFEIREGDPQAQYEMFEFARFPSLPRGPEQQEDGE